MLHVPRGWWHIARPLNEPCLHLTVTVRNPTGLDLLGWLAEKMKASETARMAVPVNATSEEQREWLGRLRADLLAQWDEMLVERFAGEKDLAARPRPTLSLPGSVTRRPAGTGPDTLVELTLPRPLYFSYVGGVASCDAGGSIWRMTREQARRLMLLNDFHPHRIGELAPRGDLVSGGIVTTMLMKSVLRRCG
jgi:hypothetical protein